MIEIAINGNKWVQITEIAPDSGRQVQMEEMAEDGYKYQRWQRQQK